MSASTSFLRQVLVIAIRESVRKSWVLDVASARMVIPVAMALFMLGLRRRARSKDGAAWVFALINRYQEDLLRNERRLAAPDVRARGDFLSDRIFRRGKTQAVRALADLAGIDLQQAAEVLSMVAAATVSAMAKAKRELNLSAPELSGVIKSEAASIDGADTELTAELWNSVMRARRPRLFLPLEKFVSTPILQAFRTLSGGKRSHPAALVRRPPTFAPPVTSNIAAAQNVIAFTPARATAPPPGQADRSMNWLRRQRAEQNTQELKYRRRIQLAE